MNPLVGHVLLHVDPSKAVPVPAPVPDQHHQSSNHAIVQEHLPVLIDALGTAIHHDQRLRTIEMIIPHEHSPIRSRSRSPQQRYHDDRYASRSSTSPSRSSQSRYRTCSVGRNRQDAATGLVSETTFGTGSAAYVIANKNESAILTLNGRVAGIEKAVDGMMASLDERSTPALTQRMDMVEDIIDVLVAEREKDSTDALSDRVAKLEEAVMKMVEMMRAFAGMRDMKRSLAAVAGITASFGGRSTMMAPDRPIKRE
ncbi:MAG: hypothetical protein Q9208_004117 [Pyrenodesmia sp. 3 TL-2023]